MKALDSFVEMVARETGLTFQQVESVLEFVEEQRAEATVLRGFQIQERIAVALERTAAAVEEALKLLRNHMAIKYPF